MTPGTYLRTRRKAAGVSIEQLLGKIGTVPHVSERERREWIEALEADVARPDAFAIGALRRCFAFDGDVLAQLVDRHHFGARLPAPRLCRRCACSQDDPCLDGSPGGTCGWAEYDLCTSCTPRLAPAPALPVPANLNGANAGAAA